VDEICRAVRIDGANGMRDAAPRNVEPLPPVYLVERRPVGRDLHDAERPVDHFTDRMKRCVGSVGETVVEVAGLGGEFLRPHTAGKEHAHDGHEYHQAWPHRASL
jgi:hypothetical protein